MEELHPPVEEEKEEEGIDIEAKEEITFDDFMKMQFQVGEIIACEEVKKIEKITLLAGENRKSGKTDCVRYQRTLYSRRNGWQKSYGTCEFEACKNLQGFCQKVCFCVQKMQKVTLR